MTVASRSGRVSGDGLLLAYREWGGGQRHASPLVLLHGLTGRAIDWEPVARPLALKRRVIALDARGHGGSDWAPDAAYAGDAHFADVATALDALGIGRCTLAGYSMGGSVAILVAGALQERVDRLVVVDSYPAPDMTPGSRRIAEVVAALYGAVADAHSLADRGRRSERRPSFDPAIARKIAEELEAGDARRLDLWLMWETLRCPVLLVRGEHSDVLPAPLAAEMLARQPRARLAIVRGAAHQIPFSHPGELARLIEEEESVRMKDEE